MGELYKYKPPTLEQSLENFKKFPSTGINLEVLADSIKSGKLIAEQQSELNDTFVRGYNEALVLCFPKNAFDILRGQNMIAENIPPQERLDLEKEWNEIAKLAKIEIAQENITTEAAFKHFQQFKPGDFPDYEAICKKISLYISECMRRAHAEKNYLLLERVIPAFKLLAYFHKLHERVHYWCEAEFNDMVHFGVDPNKLEFKYLDKKDVRERFFDDVIAVNG